MIVRSINQIRGNHIPIVAENVPIVIQTVSSMIKMESINFPLTDLDFFVLK